MPRPQYGPPIQDISNTGWTPSSNYFSRIDEQTAPPGPSGPPGTDNQYVESSSDPGGDAFEVKLDEFSWPQPGDQILRVRLRRADSPPPSGIPVIVQLLQGQTTIVTQQVTVNSSFQTVSVALNNYQKALITDYTDLRVRVIAGNVATGCCQQDLYPQLTVTFSAPGCALDGQTAPLVWTPADNQWSFEGLICNSGWLVYLRCQGTAVTDLLLGVGGLQPGGCVGPFTANAKSGGACDPPDLEFEFADPFNFDCNCGNEGQHFSAKVTL